VLVVLAPVDQHLALAQLLLLLRDDQLRVLGLEVAGERVREPLGPVVVVDLVVVERHVDLDALRARRLREALQAQLRERLAQHERHLAALAQAGPGPRIEVERHHARPVDVVHERQRRVQLEVGQVREPDQRREVVADAEVDRLRAQLDRLRAHPLRAVRGTLLLVEVPALDAVGIALEGERAVAQVRQHRGRDAGVVVDHLTLGEPHRGIHHLVQVRQREPPALDVDIDARGRRH
jgi:hypothetical protein